MNKFDKALHLCKSTDGLRDWMQQPFLIKDTVYSTDAHVMLMVPKKEVEEAYGILSEKRLIKNIDNLLTYDINQDTDISVQELKDAIDSIPLTDEYEEDEEECGECNGEGEVEWEYNSHTRFFDCPECEGFGVTKTKKTTGNKIREDGYNISIGDSKFRAAIIEQIVWVANFLEETRVKLIFQAQPNNQSVFKIGESEMLVMPVMTDSSSKSIKKFELK